MTRKKFLAAVAAVLITAGFAAVAEAQVKKPLVIGHRGASGYLPEHTLAAYDLAITQGADFIEPDLVMTRDGVLVARHENDITATTNVADKFPDRKRRKSIDGEIVEGWFTEDFTLAELKVLRARQPRAYRDQSHNDRYEIPTLQEVIDLAKRRGAELGRTIGIYPETKHPTYHAQQGLPMEETLIAILHGNGYTGRNAPMFIQSFEVGNLKKLRRMTDLPLVQLFDEFDARPFDFLLAGDKRTYRDLMTPAGLAEVAAYAQGVGPWKRTIVEENADKSLKPANSFIADAHKVGLVVHPYTFRNERQFLAVNYEADPVKEYLQFYRLGVDGVFTDFPDTAVAARGQL
jgi:glycerophosphoryl diester phosphodiesterase